MEDDLNEDVFLQEGLCPSIAERATQCNSLFQRKMAITDIVPDPTIMDDQLARFTLWANNMDVYGPPNVSLDYRLRYSPTVVQILHELLDVIWETLDSCKCLPLHDFGMDCRSRMFTDGDSPRQCNQSTNNNHRVRNGQRKDSA